MAECFRCGKIEGPALNMKILCFDCAHQSVSESLDPDAVLARVFGKVANKSEAWWEL